MTSDGGKQTPEKKNIYMNDTQRKKMNKTEKDNTKKKSCGGKKYIYIHVKFMKTIGAKRNHDKEKWNLLDSIHSCTEIKKKC